MSALLYSLDRYLGELAAQGGLVSRKHRRAFPVVADRARLADSLVRQLAALGLERRERPPLDLGAYLATRYSAEATPGPRPESEAGADHAPGAAIASGGRGDAEASP